MDEAGAPADRRQGQKSSRGKGNYKPKGRLVDAAALAEIQQILGPAAPRRLALATASQPSLPLAGPTSLPRRSSRRRPRRCRQLTSICSFWIVTTC